MLDDIEYPIPYPWIGNKLDTPSLTMDDFAMIPRDHARDGMRLYITKDAHAALLRLLEAAMDDGLVLKVESGYRSPGYQKKIFRRMLDEGRTFDDIVRYVAPPGYSEHGLGIAVDFSPSNWEFAATPGYSWLHENAGRFGFQETYPENNSLDYPWESWHWAYDADLDDPFQSH